MPTHGVIRVDHHQFNLGSVETDTLATITEGSLIDVGPGFVTVRTGIAYGPCNRGTVRLAPAPLQVRPHDR